MGNENQGLHDVLVDTELLDTLENLGVGRLVFFIHKPKKDIECRIEIVPSRSKYRNNTTPATSLNRLASLKSLQSRSGHAGLIPSHGS